MNDISYTSLMPTLRQPSATKEGSQDPFAGMDSRRSDVDGKSSLDRSMKLYTGASIDQIDTGSTNTKLKMIKGLQTDYKEVKL